MNEIVKKKRKKIILIILIIIVGIGLLIPLFGTIDYFRASKGKKPIFIYKTLNVSPFDVALAGFEDVASINEKEGATYYGVGYTISTCNKETKKYIYKLGHKKSITCDETVTCTKTTSENDKIEFSYTIYDNELITIYKSLTIPSSKIKNKKNYEKDFMKINDISGCNGSFKKINDKAYFAIEACNVTKMTDKDMQKVYSKNKETLEQTKAEIINSYAKDKNMICN